MKNKGLKKGHNMLMGLTEYTCMSWLMHIYTSKGSYVASYMGGACDTD